MLRKLIFKNLESGEELVLPVTPKEYSASHGRTVNALTLQTVGTVNLPGPQALLDTVLECVLPAREYPFAIPGAGTNPFVPLEKLEKWSDAGKPVRFVVSDTPVNTLVLLGVIQYGEQDGTNDLYVRIPIRGYPQLTAQAFQQASGENAPRAAETPPEPPRTYTVQAGDTLSSISRRFYGDASLYPRLAAANGIQNANLIYPGQVLTLPDVGSLPTAAADTGGRVSTGTSRSAAQYRLSVEFVGAPKWRGTGRVSFRTEKGPISLGIGTGLSTMVNAGTEVTVTAYPKEGGWLYNCMVNGKKTGLYAGGFSGQCSFVLEKDTSVYIGCAEKG